MLKAGDKAPEFTAEDQAGNRVSLSAVLGEGKRVILYFYPKDNTSGCTAEACSLRDGYGELLAKGFTVVGVSPDGAGTHRRFIEKHQLPFRLLVDADHAIAEAYGTWGEKKFMGRTYMGMLRTTFVIGTDGVIEKVFEKVETKRHFEQIVEWDEARD
jgi:peroxiredoxin Q/BCP